MTDQSSGPSQALPSAIEELLAGSPRDVVGLPVARILPTVRRRSVGHFVFVDHMGPYVAKREVYVRPHPHIGLATVTYLLDGAFLHRDSLGTRQVIEPGAVNWMTAGKWIVHSERTVVGANESTEVARASLVTIANGKPAQLADQRPPVAEFDPHLLGAVLGEAQGPSAQVDFAVARLHGIQTWVALPLAVEECEPSFQHVPHADVPELRREGCTLRVIAGTAFGERSPVEVPVPLLYVHVAGSKGARLTIPDEHEERAIYVASGEVLLDGHALAPHQLAVLRSGGTPLLEFASEAQVFLLGGAPLEARRFMEWNFVSSERARIDAAKVAWREGRYEGIEGETDVIPLPEEAPHR